MSLGQFLSKIPCAECFRRNLLWELPLKEVEMASRLISCGLHLKLSPLDSLFGQLVPSYWFCFSTRGIIWEMELYCMPCNYREGLWSFVTWLPLPLLSLLLGCWSNVVGWPHASSLDLGIFKEITVGQCFFSFLIHPVKTLIPNVDFLGGEGGILTL